MIKGGNFGFCWWTDVPSRSFWWKRWAAGETGKIYPADKK